MEDQAADRDDRSQGATTERANRARTFKADGTWQKRGGNDLDGKFVLTPKGLVIEALGPALEYRVDKLTATELMVTATIMDGMTNATILEREN